MLFVLPIAGYPFSCGSLLTATVALWQAIRDIPTTHSLA
jgi:hypothetical protein